MTISAAIHEMLVAHFQQWSVRWSAARDGGEALRAAASDDVMAFLNTMAARGFLTLDAIAWSLNTHTLPDMRAAVPTDEVARFGLSAEEQSAFQREVADELWIALSEAATLTPSSPRSAPTVESSKQSAGGTLGGLLGGLLGGIAGAAGGLIGKVMPASLPPLSAKDPGGAGTVRERPSDGQSDGSPPVEDLASGEESNSIPPYSNPTLDVAGRDAPWNGLPYDEPYPSNPPVGPPPVPLVWPLPDADPMGPPDAPPPVPMLVPPPGDPMRPPGGPPPVPMRLPPPDGDPAAPPVGPPVGPPHEPPIGPPSTRTLGSRVILSAQAPQQLTVGQDAGIDVRVECEGAAAQPYAIRSFAALPNREKLGVVISIIDGDAVSLVEPFFRQLDVPSPGSPETTQFAIHARREGEVRIALQFLQGSAMVGSLQLTLRVVAVLTDGDVRVSASTDRTSPSAGSQDVLSLYILETRDGQQITYRYLLSWEAKRLLFQDFCSAPFLDRGSGVAATPLAFVQSLYRRIADRLVANAGDVADFRDELQGIGLSMSEQLFSRELNELLWTHRDDLQQIRITSQEAYVPWELLVLRNPNAVGPASVDERHLAERRLIRTISGVQPPDRLALRDWRYVMSEFPHNSFTPAASERPFFEADLPSRGVNVAPIAPTPSDVLKALSQPDFDVLHFAGHGSATPERIDEAMLILGDRRTPNDGIQPIGLQPATLSQKYDLSARHPVVFLNACETGLQAPSLTNLGGWPKKFLKLGASVFVGTSWAVRDKPAAIFSRTFYDYLLGGETLSDATEAARAATQRVGDASWLAYTVYGAPSARLESTLPPSA